MNRRGFLASVAAVIAAPVVAPTVQPKPQSTSTHFEDPYQWTAYYDSEKRLIYYSQGDGGQKAFFFPTPSIFFPK